MIKGYNQSKESCQNPSKDIKRRAKKTKRANLILTFILVLLIFPLFVFSSDAPAVQPGDVNGDGQVDFTDAQLIFDHVAGNGNLNTEELYFADINGDSKISIADAAMLFRYVSKQIDTLPYEPGKGILRIVNYPEKTEFLLFEKIDFKGLKLCVEYAGGKTLPVENYDIKILGDVNVPGVKIVLVSSGEQKIAFTADILDTPPTGIRAFAKNALCFVGTEPDLSAIEVYGIYGGGKEARLAGFSVSGFDSSAAGVYNAEVFCRGFKTAVEVKILPRKAKVNTGDSSLNLRPTPDTDKEPVAVLPSGTRVEVLQLLDRWVKVRVETGGKTAEGYCFADYIEYE